jgi:hypothetical protein
LSWGNCSSFDLLLTICDVPRKDMTAVHLAQPDLAVTLCRREQGLYLLIQIYTRTGCCPRL